MKYACKPMTLDKFNAELAAGPYAWPGGYPRYFVMADGGVLSFKAAQNEAARIRDELADPCDPAWLPAAVDVNWKDPALYCDHTGERIESAYAED